MLGTNQMVNMLLYYKIKELKNGFKKIIIIDKSKEGDAQKIIEEEASLPEREKTVYVIKTTWKILSWRDVNNVNRDSMVVNPEGRQEIDSIIWRDLRLKRALVGWDLKDDKNYQIDISSEAIDSLPAEIVGILLNRYDEIVYGGAEEDEKKVI